MLRIDIRRDAQRFMEGRPAKHRRQIATKLHELCQNPEPPDSKPMKGSRGRYRRADVGEYRIVYRVEADTLCVVVVGKRNDEEVYRQFLRQG